LSLGRIILEDFLESSVSCILAIVDRLGGLTKKVKKKVTLVNFRKNGLKNVDLNRENLFLRSSVEYSNPQLTVEEVQGIIAARLMEVCGNYFHYHGIREIDKKDIDELSEMLIKPPKGKIVSFLLNTDDVEPDRYSMNPLKESIVTSGQSAFPSASVTTEELKIDSKFVKKYNGTLISKKEVDMIDYQLGRYDNYMDMVDAVKYQYLEDLSATFDIDLSLPFMRMPLTTMKSEKNNDLIHSIISQSHIDYHTISRLYNCMGRSMKKKTTLFTVPHSEKKYGSKRAARGRIYFDNLKLSRVKVRYKTTSLYPNAIDKDDVSIAKADDSMIIEGEKFSEYEYNETPSSPQFVLYSLASPEDAVIWHGIGAFGASQLLKSYITTRVAINQKLIFNKMKKRLNTQIPLQSNLIPKNIWFHPTHRNIDASIGCVNNLADLAKLGMKMEILPISEYIRE
jgi:hypothetical protein